MVYLVVLISSCQFNHSKENKRIVLENEEPVIEIYRSLLKERFVSNQETKLWVFENYFDATELTNVEDFSKKWLRDSLIKIDRLDEYELVQIKYHPYFSEESKIDCYLIRDRKVLDHLELLGDRHGIGRVEIVEHDQGKNPKLIHELKHKVPMVEILNFDKYVYQLDLIKGKFIALGNLYSKEINCVSREDGTVTEYFRTWKGDSVHTTTKVKDYNCDNF